MIVSIHQPHYWAWLGLLNKIAQSDTYVVLDNVDVLRQSNQYRNIFYNHGREKYITLPIHKNTRTPINQLVFKNNTWQHEHLTAIQTMYAKTPFFEPIFEAIQPIYQANYNMPVEFVVATMLQAFFFFDIKVNVLYSSAIQSQYNKGELMLDLTIKAGGNTYLSGTGAKEYMLEAMPLFEQKNVTVEWQNFKHPVYEQNPQFPFLAGLSCLDILFFNGIEKSRQIFWNNLNQHKI